MFNRFADKVDPGCKNRSFLFGISAFASVVELLFDKMANTITCGDHEQICGLCSFMSRNIRRISVLYG
jgi:hypothetical protein